MTVAVFECLVCRPPEFAGALGFNEAGKSEFQAALIESGQCIAAAKRRRSRKQSGFAGQIEFVKGELRTLWKAASALDSAWGTKFRGS
jgi:hypothetical protein